MGDQSWVFIGRTDAKAETLILWPPHLKSWFIGKDPDAGKDWGQEEKGTTEDEMVGWHHWLDAHKFGWTPGVGDGHGGLACCNSWGHKESDTTEWLNWTESYSWGLHPHHLITSQRPHSCTSLWWYDFNICTFRGGHKSSVHNNFPCGIFHVKHFYFLSHDIMNDPMVNTWILTTIPSS